MKPKQGKPFDPRTLLAICHDIVVASLAWAASFWLRLNLSVPHPYDEIIAGSIVIVVCVEILIFLMCGLYRGIWRYASIFDVRRILAAVGVAALAVPTVFVLLRMGTAVPRSVYVLNPLLLICLMGVAGSPTGSGKTAWERRRFVPRVSHCWSLASMTWLSGWYASLPISPDGKWWGSWTIQAAA